MDWHHLLFLHWVVAAEQLRPLVPSALDLDLFEGRAYVGLVPFTMTGVRPVGLPAVPGLSNFHETNVRTYVHRAGRDPGVWFFSLDAANPIAVAIARTFVHLPYHHARMRMNVNPGEIAFTSRRLWPGPRPATSAIVGTPVGTPAPARPDTLECFLVERYLLYATHRDRLYQGQIHHSPYPLQSAEVPIIDENLIAAAGIERPDAAPLAHYARGVRVEAFALSRVKG
jgi:uncharacterized protein